MNCSAEPPPHRHLLTSSGGAACEYSITCEEPATLFFNFLSTQDKPSLLKTRRRPPLPPVTPIFNTEIHRAIL